MVPGSIDVSTRTFSGVSWNVNVPHRTIRWSCEGLGRKARSERVKVDFLRSRDSPGNQVIGVDCSVEGGLVARRKVSRPRMNSSIPGLQGGCRSGYHLFASVGGCSTRVGSKMGWLVRGRASLGQIGGEALGQGGKGRHRRGPRGDISGNMGGGLGGNAAAGIA